MHLQPCCVIVGSGQTRFDIVSALARARSVKHDIGSSGGFRRRRCAREKGAAIEAISYLTKDWVKIDEPKTG